MLFFGQDDRDAHQPQHEEFEPGMLAQSYRYVSHSRDVSPDTAYNVFFSVQVSLASSVEFGVVSNVVVAFCE
jgi:hypothetical protein